MSSELLSFGGEILKLAFFAGIGLAVFRQVVKDLNGLGRRVREDRLADDFRFLTIVVTALALEESKDDRKWLAGKFLEAGRRRV